MCALGSICLSVFITLAGAPTVDELLDAWEEGCGRLRSYDIYVTAESKTLLHSETRKPLEKPLVTKASSHQVFSDGRRRIESDVARLGQTPTSILVWDGKLKKSLHLAARQFAIEAGLDYAAAPGLNYESLYRTAGGDYGWFEMMRERPETKLEGTEGTQFILYTPAGIHHFQMSPFGYRIWLDSTKSFLPTRSQTLLEVSGKEIVYVEHQNTLEEVQPGVWAPTKCVTSHFPPVLQSESPPRRSAETAFTVDMDLSKFNVEVPASTFELEIPVGVRVYDRTATQPDEDTLIRRGDKAPDFRLVTLDGRTFRTSELEGKVVLIWFFSFMSGRHVAFAEDLWQRFESRDLVVLGIGVGLEDRVLASFAEWVKLTLPLGVDPDRQIFGRFARKGTPRLYLVGPDGTVACESLGYHPDLAKVADLVEAQW